MLFSKKYILFFTILFIFISLLFLSLSRQNLPFKDNSSIQNNLSVSDSESNNIDVTVGTKDILALKMFHSSIVDGAILADEHGELVVNRDLRHWIDFYLSAIGELTLIEIKELMQKEISLLPMPAREQAEKILAGYLNYKEALADYEKQFSSTVGGGHIENMSQRHDWQKRLRRQALSGEIVDAFWRLDELVDDHALEQLVINASSESDAEKANRINQLDAELPKELKDFRKNLYVASNLQETTDAFRQQGGSYEDIRQLRIEEVGLEATERLEAVDRIQQVWKQRIVAYANEIKAIANVEGVSEQDKKSHLKKYAEDNFDQNEQLRLDSALNLLAEE